MLEIKPFTPSDLDFVASMAREQDFAPGVGDIEIYANTDCQGIWLALQDNAGAASPPSQPQLRLHWPVCGEARAQAGNRPSPWQHALKP